MVASFKKILIVSNNAFTPMNNNGKTYEALFSGFPKGTLAQLFFNHNENPDFDFCSDYFKITDTDVLKNLFSPGRKHGGKCLPPAKEAIKTGLPANEPPHISAGNSKFFLWLKSLSDYIAVFRDLVWKLNTWKTRSLFSWIEEFSPSAIFFIVGSPGYPQDVVHFIRNKYKIPLIIYFTDDYILNAVPKNFFDRIRMLRMKEVYNRTVNSASLCFAIGEQMCREYSEYFGKSFIPVMNSVKVVPYKNKLPGKSVLKITFIGGLHLNRWKMISSLSGMLKEISTRVKTEVNVYSVSELTPEIELSFRENDVVYKGCVFDEELSRVLSEADILLHVESDETYYRRLTRLSVSTKIPEYLMTGNLVLAFGPPEVASLQLLSKNKIGIVISSEEERNVIKAKLGEIISNQEERIITGKRGYDFAVENFDIDKVHKLFMEKIISI